MAHESRRSIGAASMHEAEGSLRMSEVIAALSFSLDLTEGQVMGHAVRSCVFGMRLAQEIGLPRELHGDL